MGKDKHQTRTLLVELSRLFILASWLPGTPRPGAEVTGETDPDIPTLFPEDPHPLTRQLILPTWPYQPYPQRSVELSGATGHPRSGCISAGCKATASLSLPPPTMPLTMAPGTENREGSLGMQAGNPH